MAKDKCIIQCRLRSGKDDDLRDAIDKLPASKDKSDVLRDALRLYFFDGHKNEDKIMPPSAAVTIDKKEEPVQLQKVQEPEDSLSGKLDDLLGEF
ncbi:hypothetical protein NOM01_10890 [Sporolactobacillus sp. STSJ-5]|uniref:hypothetical protein n=1 Tax=Sporolactobacillus sp. STSJ-5 TaxID=2965076 RepID=UPI00210506F6|nr:hypothetical protein [Sporolactobacillus sp. STSJ-5]MCQ2010521.1 hypothetical protein [Sporolactobacillus sp. STSJ-5]